MDLWQAIGSIPHIGFLLPYIAAVGLICAALSTILPPPAEPNGWYYYLFRTINFIGLHIGHAETSHVAVLKQKREALKQLQQH